MSKYIDIDWNRSSLIVIVSALSRAMRSVSVVRRQHDLLAGLRMVTIVGSCSKSRERGGSRGRARQQHGQRSSADDTLTEACFVFVQFLIPADEKLAREFFFIFKKIKNIFPPKKEK